MKVFTIWIALDPGHTHLLMDRSHDGAPLWFVTRSHAVEWIAEEFFGEADWLPVSVEVREIHVSPRSYKMGQGQFSPRKWSPHHENHLSHLQHQP
jgi:hypothetical protein